MNVSLLGAGQGKHGSVWLTAALESNSADPNARITHEAFRLRPWRTFDYWLRKPDPITIDTNVSLEMLLPLIETFKARVGVILREPISWITSLFGHAAKKGLAFDTSSMPLWRRAIRHTAMATFSRLETVLGIVELTKCPSRCWSLKHCGTEPGLRELAAWVELPLRKDVRLPKRLNVTPPERRFDLRKQCPTSWEEIYGVVRDLDRVRAAYESVGVTVA
jgi:hypothetical protein